MSDGFDSNQTWSQQTAQAVNAGDVCDIGDWGWAQDDFDSDASQCAPTYDSEKHVKVMGACFGKKSIADDVRTAPEVEARHVDPGRDAEAGVELSLYNLNYSFNKKVTFKTASLTERLGAPIEEETLPAEVDLSADATALIYDQGAIGTCVAHTTAYAIRRVYKKQTGKFFMPSRLFIYYYGRLMAGLSTNADTGLTITEGYRAVDRYSACDESLWKYDAKMYKEKPNTAAIGAALKMPNFGWVTLRSDLAELKKCLADGFYISFGAALFSSFMSAEVAKTGVVPSPNPSKEDRVGSHAMTIVGYSDTKKVFIVVNSWSPRWGRRGLCEIPYDYILDKRYCGDFCSARTFN